MDSQRAKDMFEAQSQLYRLMFSFISSMGLKAATELGIADIIHSHGHPITLPELVLALRIDPARSSFVYRLMRLLAHSGLFVRTKVAKQGKEEDGYDLTPCSRLLLKHNVPNLSSVVKVSIEPPLSEPFQVLGEWFHRDGEVKVNPFQAVFGKGFWEYGRENPEFANLFNKAMGSDSGMMNLVIRGCRDVFEGVNSLVDAGGGVGEVARIISEEFPNMKCTVLDLPHVVAGLEDSENLKFVGGDMFHSIPSADAIFFKLVLHIFSDEECVKILKKCREAISGKDKEGKVIIVDVVINEKKDMHEFTETKLYFDLMMMAQTPGGREREEREWEKLFIETGFFHYNITLIFGLRSLIQVYP